MEKVNPSCIEKIYSIDTDNKRTILDNLMSLIHEAEVVLIKSESDVSLLKNRKHKNMKRITTDLFKTIDEM